jgi:hypothetical protein
MNLKLSFILLLLAQICFAQKYDTNKISKNNIVNLLESEFVGFEYHGVVYYVENDLKSLIAVEKQTNKIKWKTDVISACGIPSEGKPEIRYLKLHKKNIHVIYGKHNEAVIEADDGSLFLCGSD